jgi:hypothetical protein
MHSSTVPASLACLVPEVNLYGAVAVNEELTFPRGGILQETLGRSPSATLGDVRAVLHNDERRPQKCTRTDEEIDVYRLPFEMGIGWTGYWRPVPLRPSPLADVPGEVASYAYRLGSGFLFEYQIWSDGLFVNLLTAGTGTESESLRAIERVAVNLGVDVPGA